MTALEVRDAQESDLGDLVALLGHLTKVEKMDAGTLQKIHRARIQAGIVTKVVVDPASGAIVGTASLLVEPKFVRGGSFVGHVEDVVTDPSFRGKGIGHMLLDSLIEEARARDCYKVILDCNDSNVPFYEKKGFRKCENQMRLDISSHL